MVADLLELYERASAWTLDKVAGATQKLDAATPCEGWDVRTLMNHMLQTQQYFVHSARGEKASLPRGPHPRSSATTRWLPSRKLAPRRCGPSGRTG